MAATTVNPEIETRALTTVEQARLVVVDSIEQRTYAGELGRGIAGLDKELEEWFAPMKQAAAKAHREICAKENAVRDPLKAAKQYLSGQIGSYDQRQEAIRRAAEARLQEEARKVAEAEAARLAQEQAIQDAIALEAQGDTKAAEAVLNHPAPVEVFVPPVVIAREAPKVTGVSARKNYKFRITDPDKINRDFMVPDEKKIRQVVNALGLKAAAQIGGIEVYEESSASFRA